MIALLLHMHQPDYRDPKDGRPTMPWVRLHATRGYRDVPLLAKKLGARLTLNLVPSLIDQWDFYAAGGKDIHQELAERSVQSLRPHEVSWMLESFFHGHPSSFRWFPAWGRLRARRDAGEHFDAQALQDLQVWTNLAWFGFTALQDWPELGELRRKGAGFSEAEKLRVLQIQSQILRDLKGLYRGGPEISASPYFHPILPLLVDNAHAQRCMPGNPDPGFRFPEDARLQLRAARQRVGQVAGVEPAGLWPSEGSVSPEVVELSADAGFSWFATDQGVLERSERDGGRAGHRGSWQVGPLRGLFRDRELSDRIGFVYGSWDGKKAAADLLHRAGDAPVLLALDGENPWEGYADAGERFLSELLGSGRTRSCAELAAEPPVGNLRRIHTGSWINADFGIWIGQKEDQEAWTLLREARQGWEEAGRPAAARMHLLAAEGSDWFWWYGDDFSTPFAAEFDRLFRAHLSAAWRAMGREVPAVLSRPIKKQDPRRTRVPTAALPADDGSWAAWAGAGGVDLRSGSMAPLPDMPQRLLFGERAGRLALKLVPAATGWRVVWRGGAADFSAAGAEIPPVRELHLEGPGGHRLPAEGSLELPALKSSARSWDPQLGPLP